VLAPIGSIPSGGSNPHSLVISPGGFLYCANVNLQLVSDVSEFSINSSTGALTLINTYTVGLGEPLDTGALWISFDPTGKHAYIGTLAEIAQFTVGGAVETLSSNGTVADPHSHLSGGVDPSGRFVFSVGGIALSTGTSSAVPGCSLQTARSCWEGTSHRRFSPSRSSRFSTFMKAEQLDVPQG
jgi:hypothetical protein